MPTGSGLLLRAESASPLTIPFNNSKSVGPDGPWNVITISVTWPEQLIDVFPGSAKPSVFVTTGACQLQSSNCQQPQPLSYDFSASRNKPLKTRSSQKAPSFWDEDTAEAMRLDGLGYYMRERVTLHQPADYWLDGANAFVSDNVTARYPGGQQYTLDVGLLSLGVSHENYVTINGTNTSTTTQMDIAFKQGIIPSRSFGLHIGSATYNITGSLLWGGYDSSRCIDRPATAVNKTFDLLDIGIVVGKGSSPFESVSSDGLQGMLRVDSDPSPITILPNPAIPYLFLPKATCDALASHLPVTYNSELGLYLWITANPKYQQIIKSPSYLSFIFASSPNHTAKTTINVHFGLLNLRLQPPLTTSPTAYFPCSPFTPSVGSQPVYQLGRAFLQAAFLGQDLDFGTSFLAQAPGPQRPAPSIKSIQSSGDSFLAMQNPPSWESTWEAVSTPLSAMPTTSTTSSLINASHLSTGDKAGIALGLIFFVIALVVIGFSYVRRRNRKDGMVDSAGHSSSSVYELKEGEVVHEKGDESLKPEELPSYREPGELPSDREPVELNASNT
ncbi:MAG: hypothetical protein M1836_002498 [Candelina mexicana]|nr:MAG: hypothetical protein M1836_002498 [Candelina mexicana]